MTPARRLLVNQIPPVLNTSIRGTFLVHYASGVAGASGQAAAYRRGLSAPAGPGVVKSRPDLGRIGMVQVVEDGQALPPVALLRHSA